LVRRSDFSAAAFAAIWPQPRRHHRRPSLRFEQNLSSNA
jgi:hypothetical protein